MLVSRAMVRALRALTATSGVLALAACGGGSSPMGPSDPGAGSVIVVVFYDENANGVLDGGEAVRLPGVLVSVAGQSGQTEAFSGRVMLSGIAPGSHEVTVDASTLPPFFAPPMATVTATVSQTGSEVYYPVTLPIGGNHPNTYMAFGNSITNGSGLSDGQSYRGSLQESLESHFGRAEIFNEGLGSTTSRDGAERVAERLQALRPAYNLILYGTNDFHHSGCRRVETLDTCFTIPSLRTIVRETLAAGSLPVLATILPPNEGFDWRAPPQRTEWVSIQDEHIRVMAQEEGALLVDLEAAFLQAGPLDALFEDHIHPTAEGFELMASTFFEAIAHGSTP